MSENGREELHPADDAFGLEAVRELLRLISETDVTEIQIERGDTKLHIKRGATAHHAAPSFVMTPSLAGGLTYASVQPPPAAPHSSPAPPVASGDHEPAGEAEVPAGSLLITAPMVGTYYASPSPKDPPFVQEGDEIKPGDVVGIVEAMKLMNEIESEFAGRIVRILVSNGQPVEYGQVLMVVEPA